MISKIPNVARTELPELADAVDRYAMRYEYRLDGSSLWEGRVVPVAPSPNKTERAAPRGIDHPAARLRRERMLRYPRFTLPEGFALVEGTWYQPVLRFYRNDRARAVLALQDFDLFLVHHPDEDGYRWEIERIETLCRDPKSFVRPRELFTGIDFTLAHRVRCIEEGRSWL